MICSYKDLFYYSNKLLNFRIIHGFGIKKLGDGREVSHLQNLLQKENITYKSIVIPKQTHSTDVRIITSRDAINRISTIKNGDGLITKEKGIVLTVITADCLPIIYYDKKNKIIGISHQGWKGTLHKLPERMIVEMEVMGAERSFIQCIFGPAINDCCYEIFGDRYEQFKYIFGESIFRKDKSNMYLNLYKANYQTLQNIGISEDQIDFFPFCTSCNQEKFWSFHREKSIEGEMIHFVVIDL